MLEHRFEQHQTAYPLGVQSGVGSCGGPTERVADEVDPFGRRRRIDLVDPDRLVLDRRQRSRLQGQPASPSTSTAITEW